MTSRSWIMSVLFYVSFSILSGAAENVTNSKNVSRHSNIQNASTDLSYLLPPNVHSTIKVALTICDGLLLVGALLGNILVIHVVRSNLRMRTTTNILITNMAVSDLLIALIFIPSQTIRLYVGSAWLAGIFGMITCKVVMSSRLISVACSTLSLVAIAIDRYYAIVHPLRRRVRHRSHKKTWAVCVIWLLSLLICIPPMSFYKQVTMANGDAYCTTVFMFGSMGKAYILGGFVLTFMVPLLIMTVLYIIVGFKLYTRSLPGYNSETYKEHVLMTSRRVTKMMVTVVISFAVCMLPIQIYLFNRFFNNSVMSSSGLFWGFTLTAFLSNFNAFINPCLYVVFNRKFRKGFKNALLCNQVADLFSVSADSKMVFVLQLKCQKTGTWELNTIERKENLNKEKNEKKNGKETRNMAGSRDLYMAGSRDLVTLTAVKTLDTV